MAKFVWIKENLPSDIEVKQVYGICFTKNGKVLLRIENGKYQLTGGKPDVDDDDFCDTLRREFIEEANTIIENPVIVGYQLVDEEDGSLPYAQVRMTGLIKEINSPKSDSDRSGNWIYGRVLVSPLKAGELLGWGNIGIEQVNDAWIIAKDRYDLKEFDDNIIIINEESRDNL